jgi:ABC-type nitrate/sulfonate/bicarbonate transport system substrate-binding protein
MKTLATILMILLVAACTPAATPSPSVPSSAGASLPATSPSAPGSAGSPSPSASPFAGTPSTVRLALDWTPNTDHTGFFVARHRGGYAAAGINLQILPYATSAPETLLAAHQAECGISFQDSLTFAVAAGADIVSVAAILQRTASAIGVLADSPITRPRDLDG